MMGRRQDVDQRARAIEELVRKLESSADAGLRATARELVQALMDLHRAGLERALELVDQTGDPGRVVIDRLAEDDIVKHLLVLHGLHPLSLDARVHQAIENSRRSLQTQGAEVEHVVVDDAGRVHVTLRVGNGSGHGCGSPAETLRAAVEDAIYDSAPDAVGLAVDVKTEVPAVSAFVSMSSLRRRRTDTSPDASRTEGGVAHP
jgi:Fe-S cluster biogenesis protein NfuA